jgi:RimJ/RimL family protein N-acetyltransferase
LTGVVLETPRLALRELTADDLDFVAAMLDDAEVMRFYPQRYDRAGAQVWIERQIERYRREGHGLWLAVVRDTGAPVGQVGLHNQEVDGVLWPEIGYLLHRPFWGRGFATEAACAVRDHAFAHYGYARVISLIRPDNAASQAVARRMGMGEVGTTEHAGMPHLVFALDRPAGG